MDPDVLSDCLCACLPGAPLPATCDHPPHLYLPLPLDKVKQLKAAKDELEFLTLLGPTTIQHVNQKQAPETPAPDHVFIVVEWRQKRPISNSWNYPTLEKTLSGTVELYTSTHYNPKSTPVVRHVHISLLYKSKPAGCDPQGNLREIVRHRALLEITLESASTLVDAIADGTFKKWESLTEDESLQLVTCLKNRFRTGSDGPSLLTLTSPGPNIGPRTEPDQDQEPAVLAVRSRTASIPIFQ